MDLSKLSRDDLVIVSTMLMEGYKLEEVENTFVPTTMRDIVYNLHTLLCNKDHSEGGCSFYLDTSYTKAAKEWLGKASEIMKKFNVNEDDMLAALATAYELDSRLGERGVVGIIARHLLHSLFEGQIADYLSIHSEQDHSPQS